MTGLINGAMQRKQSIFPSEYLEVEDRFTTPGIELLLEKCRNEFRCPENTDYYAGADYKETERKFVKLCLLDDPGVGARDDNIP